MLTYKATQTLPQTVSDPQALDSDSDSEYDGGEQYDGDAESTYFTEEEGRENSSSPFQILNSEDEDVIETDNLLDDVEVGYYSTRKVPSPSFDVPKSELMLNIHGCTGVAIALTVHTHALTVHTSCTHCTHLLHSLYTLMHSLYTLMHSLYTLMHSLYTLMHSL